MCQFISFKHNPKLMEIAVADWFSHGRTEKLTGKTEKTGWYDGHYLPSGTVQCRIPDGTDRVMEERIKRKWPTFYSFITWAVRNGAKLDAIDDTPFRQTALIWAAEHGRYDVAHLLIKAGADVTITTGGGHTALYRAALQGHSGIVQLLIAAKSDVNALDNFGITALDRAYFAGHTDVIRRLKRAGARGTLPEKKA
jgi:hypothetical protein